MTKRVEIFYQDALDNIRHIKQQEWAATRESLIAIAALVLVATMWPKGKPFLIVAIWLVAILNGLFLHSLARWIRGSRKRVRLVYREYFDADEKVTLKLPPKKKTDRWIVISMIVATAVGAAIATFVICHRQV
jgi:hypothetical protein